MADGAPQPAVKKRMLRIASGCATREAFVAVFRRFCDRESIFIATRTPKPAGADLQFSITLADGVPLIGGTGTVLESWSDETSPFGRAGMKIRFDEVTPSGRALIDELVAAGKADDPLRGGVPKSAAAAALAALAKAGPTAPSPPPSSPARATGPSGPTAKIPAIKPLPSVISKPVDGRSKTMLGMTPLKRPAKLEATPAPVAMPLAMRDIELKLPPPPAPRADPTSDEDSDEQTTGVAAKFTPDTAFPDEASWDEAANHVLGGTRVKGSDMILPANPLGGVESESLDAFVECTIYEETGSFSTDAEATAPGHPPDDWQQDDLTIPPWLQGPQGEHAFSESMAVPPPLLPLEPEKTPTPTPSEKRHHLVEAGKAFVPAPEPVPVIPRHFGRNHWPLTIALAVVTGLAGVAIGYFVVRGAADDDATVAEPSPAQGASPVEPSARATPPPTEAAPEVVAETDEPAAPAVDTPPAPEPEPAAAEPAAADPAAAEPADKPASGEIDAVRLSGKLGKDRCGAEIKSRDGTEVFIGENKIGETPLRVVLPCGEHRIELRRSRYASQAKTIELAKGTLEKVELSLSRPEHKLKITSVPGGASVKVNGRSAGTTPATVTVNGFEQARVSVELNGYRSWSTRVYVREPTTSVSAKLTADKPAAKPAPRPAARPGKSGSRAASSQPNRRN